MPSAISEMMRDEVTYFKKYQKCECCGGTDLHWLRSERPQYDWDAACKSCGHQKGFQDHQR